MKKRTVQIILGALGAFALLVTIGLAYVKLALPNVGPAPALTIRPTTAQIEHGRYLANHVAACIDCHSTRDFTKLTAPMVAGTEGKGGAGFLRKDGFPGNYYAPNLTPAHLGTWTDGELYRAITTGVSSDGHALFPVMPYKNYAQMDPDDIKDIIAYLRSLRPIENEVPASESDFPVNFIINTLPARTEGGKRPAPTDRIAYGQYLITFAACAECHTKRDDRGDPVPGMDFAGGNAFPMPTGTVYSANITPAKTGIGSWTRNAFIARFKAYAKQTHPDVQAGEANTEMPWTMYARMSEQDLGAIYDYLRTQKPVEAKSVPFVPKEKLVAAQ
ncbi:c-type cytochrome [Spirosoma arcticum]